MKKEELASYENHVVCFRHLEKKSDAMPSRWARGVVYRGVCYDLSIMYDGRPATFRIRLRAIKPEYLAEIFSLHGDRQTLLEQTVSTALCEGETQNVLLNTPLLFDTWPEEEEKGDEKISRRDFMPPLSYSI